MSAKLFYQITAGTNRLVNIERFDTSSASGQHPIVQRKNDSGFVELFHHAGGDDSDDAFRPAFALQYHGVFVHQALTLFHHCDGIAGNVGVEFLALMIALRQDFSVFFCGVIIFFDKHFHGGGCIGNSASGVDAGADAKDDIGNIVLVFFGAIFQQGL